MACLLPWKVMNTIHGHPPQASANIRQVTRLSRGPQQHGGNMEATTSQDTIQGPASSGKQTITAYGIEIVAI